MDPRFFTYSFYERLLDCLVSQEFTFHFFGDESGQKVAYLRHDCDFSIELGLKLGQFEAKKGVRATYFVMLESDAYDVREHASQLSELIQLGHQVGLHYVLNSDMDQQEKIRKQANELSDLIGESIKAFSVHRPAYLSSKGLNVTQLQVPGLINTYDEIFFKPGQYISDSNHHWRCGDPLSFLINTPHNMVQLLTHPIWWTEHECDRWKKVETFLEGSDFHMIRYFQENVAFVGEGQ